MSGTPVHVALQAPHLRFGDLIVSVIDPEQWPFVTEISASREDEPGVLAGVYKAAAPLNIIFAEAVTVDSGNRHDARLLLEPYYQQLDETDARVKAKVTQQLSRLKKSLRAEKFNDPKQKPIHPDYKVPDWMDEGVIEFGWVQVEGMREAIEQQASQVKDAENYDLETAVISADTERRLLRYVFPRKGAASVSVKHRDIPGAMGKIADGLANNKLNILSSLLRRGSVTGRKAEVVFVVEPADDSTDREEVEDRARTALANLPTTLRLGVDVTGPGNPEDVLYPRRPHEIAVRPSIFLEAEILSIRSQVPRGRRPIFVSRRFVDLEDDHSKEVVHELRRVLNEYGCEAIEALPRPGGDRTSSDAVKAKMWACEAAILLVVSTPKDERRFSENLAHECGFMQGQGKPLLPLVQDEAETDVNKHANLQGLQLGIFSRKSAMKPEDPKSIHAVIREWVAYEFSADTDSL